MAEAAYAVGRGKPPLHTRFQKGQSGNPSGKPGPAKLAKERFARALFAELERNPAELERAAPETGIAALARRMTLDAIEGRTAAQRLVLSLLDRAVGEQEAAERAAAEENMPSLDDLLWPGRALGEIAAPRQPPPRRTEVDRVSLLQGKKQGTGNPQALPARPPAANRPPPPPTANKPPPFSLLQGKTQGKEKFPRSRAQLLSGAAMFASG